MYKPKRKNLDPCKPSTTLGPLRIVIKGYKERLVILGSNFIPCERNERIYISTIGEVPFLKEDMIDKSNNTELPTSRRNIKWKCYQCSNVWEEKIVTRKYYFFCPDCQERKSSSHCMGDGCKVRPSYNYPGYSWAICCVKHLIDDDMISYRPFNKSCEDCNISASYGKEGEKTARWCKEHGDSHNAILVHEKKCKVTGCKKSARYGPERGQKIHCRQHHDKKKERNVGKRECGKDGCTKAASFNLEGIQPGILCKKHSEGLGMVNVYARICKECKSHVRYGYPGKYPDYCSVHKKPGTIDPPRGKCKHEDGNGNKCKEIATHGEIGSLGKLHPVRCFMHAREEIDINLVEEECKSCNLVSIVDREGYCEFCKPGTFENHNRSKEMRIKYFLDVNGYEYDTHNKTVDTACGKERPDFLFDHGTHYTILEVDEHSHRDRTCECEVTRMVNIVNMLGLPTWFVRFNPDGFKMKGSDRIIDNVLQKDRHRVLADILDFCKEEPPNDEKAFARIIYLYYDDWEDNEELQSIPLITNKMQ